MVLGRQPWCSNWRPSEGAVQGLGGGEFRHDSKSRPLGPVAQLDEPLNRCATLRGPPMRSGSCGPRPVAEDWAARSGKHTRAQLLMSRGSNRRFAY